MTDATSGRPLRATKLFVELAGPECAEPAGDWLDGADGVAIDGETAAAVLRGENSWRGDCLLRDADPGAMAGLRERPGVLWGCGGSIDAAMRRRDEWPDLDWLPRIEVYRPETRFDFHRAPAGEGFSMYMPDTSAIQGFRIADADGEALEGWLSRAVAEGFRSVWLHGRDAAERGRGADIELLARARRHFAGGRIWLSGGIEEPRHLQTLACEGGAKAAVVSAAVARRWGCATLLSALQFDPPERHAAFAAAPSVSCGRAGNPG